MWSPLGRRLVVKWKRERVSRKGVGENDSLLF